MTEPSSHDLHPTTGARFVFDRDSAPLTDSSASYTVVIYLPEGRHWTGWLRWVDGQATLEAKPGVESGSLEASTAWAWARAEALKLARVLHRDPRAHMVRWRGEPS